MSALLAHAKAAEAYAQACETCIANFGDDAHGTLYRMAWVHRDAAEIMRDQIKAELNPSPEVVAKIDG